MYFFKRGNSQAPLGNVSIRMKSDCDKWFHYTYDNITSNFSCLLFMETKDGGGKPNQMKCQSNLIWPKIYCHSLSQCRDINMYVLLECRGPWEPLSSHRDLLFSGMSPVLSTLTNFCLHCYFFFHAWVPVHAHTTSWWYSSHHHSIVFIYSIYQYWSLSN